MVYKNERMGQMADESIVSWFFLTVADMFLLAAFIRSAIREHEQRLSEDIWTKEGRK